MTTRFTRTILKIGDHIRDRLGADHIVDFALCEELANGEDHAPFDFSDRDDWGGDRRGWIIDLLPTKQGLDALIEIDRIKDAELLLKFPKLGVRTTLTPRSAGRPRIDRVVGTTRGEQGSGTWTHGTGNWREFTAEPPPRSGVIELSNTDTRIYDPSSGKTYDGIRRPGHPWGHEITPTPLPGRTDLEQEVDAYLRHNNLKSGRRLKPPVDDPRVPSWDRATQDFYRENSYLFGGPNKQRVPDQAEARRQRLVEYVDGYLQQHGV